jgi:hypothetical protein
MWYWTTIRINIVHAIGEELSNFPRSNLSRLECTLFSKGVNLEYLWLLGTGWYMIVVNQ